MNILVTGSAGFIGSSTSIRLLELKHKVIGIDNHNDYYDINLKEARFERNSKYDNYLHYRVDIIDKKKIEQIFNLHKPEIVINFAAQPGVRYSLKNPDAYIQSNIVGFVNILECCRHNKVRHLIYASSSSVYGANTKLPFSEHDNSNHPLSLYAATKRSNELIAHSYSHIYGLPTTGLRFFTVYGPWGRPDMALFKFTKAILENKSVDIFNNGKHKRDFTYIDDVVNAVIEMVKFLPKSNKNWKGINPDPATSKSPWRIFNIGNNNPETLYDYIKVIEKTLGVKAKKNFLRLQPGDLLETSANIDDFKNQFNFKTNTNISEGIQKFVSWFRDYYKI
jgi:UDP-glucuronate 4-epimerase